MNFKANNGNTLCWSTSLATSSCIDRLCTYLAAKTNEECEGHLPNSNCITDGTTCI